MKRWLPIAALVIAILLTIPASSQTQSWTRACPGEGARVVTEHRPDGIMVTCYGAEQPTPTATSVPPTPTGTPEPGPTDTPQPPTPTPEPGHDVTVWHPPSNYHHHGTDPAAAGALGAFFVQHAGQEIGYPWLSSPLENQYPYPGKHEGFKLLYDDDTGCVGSGTDN